MLSQLLFLNYNIHTQYLESPLPFQELCVLNVDFRQLHVMSYALDEVRSLVLHETRGERLVDGLDMVVIIGSKSCKFCCAVTCLIILLLIEIYLLR